MTEEKNDRVVVTIRCSTRYDEENENFVAHFTDLGLVARGHTEDEAVTNCKQLFNKLVNSYRRYGGLAERLDRSGADWWWESDYPTTAPVAENTDLLMSEIREISAHDTLHEELLVPSPREFAMAA